ncbi:cystathionine beta-lyase [Actinorhabdospora filicis]|uniref:Homocysteine desulfhydrase n=1 Tax=Actinorhabdospora filicis TaxID=1785913 RepID=A0A9W6SRJ0_9ACTN|nr:PLP-dependent transferase [Actinorhabdospora filicis]GLZ80664.1 cystathionine beta-lyase [Actinorhabdospora filicis]
MSPNIDTVAVHGGEVRPGPEGSVVHPIYQGTVFAVPAGTDYHDIKYLRLSSTPTQNYLHGKLAALEGAEAALATASGMAAISATLLTFLKTGDHIIVGDTLYGGTQDFLDHHAPELGWTVTAVDPAKPETWADALTPTTRAFYVETITNPLMRVGRIPEVAAFAREHGLVSIVDNTFASPVNFRPLEAGCDIVLHSATKYLNGHSDLVAGVVAGSAELVARVRHSLNHYGGSLDAHAAYLLARGVKTLALRVERQNANAAALAEFLAGHESVTTVNYAGQSWHPDHEHARTFLSGFGGMLSLRLAGGVPAAERLIEGLELPYGAPSLGGVESLITRPALTSHAGMTREAREAVGITDDLIRVSCGIESAEDLIADFARALK